MYLLPSISIKKLSLLLALLLAFSICFSGIAPPPSSAAMGILVTATNPAQNAENVPVSIPELTVTFNQAVSPDQNFNAITLKEVVSNSIVPITREIRDGNVLVLRPQTVLNYSTEHTVIIPGGAVGFISQAGKVINQQYSYRFTTQSQPVQINLNVDPAAVTLPVGGQQQLNVTVNPADSTLSYGTSNPAVAIVDGTGKITAVAIGTANVTVTATKTGWIDAVRVVPVEVKGAINLDVSPATVSLMVGGEQNLTVSVSPSGTTVNFSSGNSAVATVDGTGKITAAGIGNTSVTVTASKPGYFDATRSVPVEVKGLIDLTVSPLSVSMETGEQRQLTVSVNPSDANLSYGSGNPAVVTVDTAGKITAVGLGDTSVTVTASKAGYVNAQKSVPVHVGLAQVMLSVSPANASLVMGQQQQLTVTVNPADANVTYATDSPAVATVDASGKITAVGQGSTNITVNATKAGYIPASKVIPVEVKGVIDLTVSPSPVSVTVGDQQQLNIAMIPADASVSFSTDNASVATVDGAGKITGVSMGNATITITATKAGYVDAVRTVPVTVKGAITLNVSPSAVELPVGGQQQITVTVDPSDSTISYGSDNPAVATVDAGGKITAVSPGNANITVSAAKTGYTMITIPVTVTVLGEISLSVDPLTVNLTVGGQQQLTVFVSPSDAGVSFSSGNNSVATVDGAGRITAVGAGSTNVTVTAAKAGYATATRTVTVQVQQPCQIELSVSPSPVSLAVNGQQQLTATVSPSDAVVSYQSNNTSVATVDVTGRITAIYAGTTSITVTATKSGCTNATRNVQVTVTGGTGPVPILVVDTDPDNNAQNVPENIPEITVTFNVPVTPDNSFNSITLKEVVSNLTVPVAREIRGGNVLALTPQAPLKPRTLHTVIIPGGAVGYNSSAGRIINQQYHFEFTTGETVGLSVSPNPVNLVAGGQQQLSVTVNPTDATVSYSSDNPSAATVSAGGLISAVCNGSATISVTANKSGYITSTKTVLVTVEKCPMTLSVDSVGALSVGQTAQINGSTVPGGATITYVSDNEAVATVSPTGLIMAVCNGSANITITASKACCNDAVQTITVTVNKCDMILTVDPVGALKVGQTAQINSTTNPGGASITYVSDNPAVASVSGTGLITAVCNGSASITVTASKACCNDAVQTITVTVNKGEMTLTVEPVEEFAVGQTAQINATTVPGGAAFTYSSDNPAVATVSQTGLITAVCNGSANITVTATRDCYNSVFQVIPITVSKGTMSLTVEPVGSLSVGRSAQISAGTVPGGAAFSYGSDNPAVATVSDTGLLTAVCAGSANITVTATRNCYENAVQVIAVTVAPGEISLTVSPLDVNLGVNGQQQLTFNAVPDGVTYSFASNDEAVATVDASGLITAKALGSANITVTASKQPCYSNKTVTVTVNVTGLLGDIDGDGKVTVLDVVMAVNIALEKYQPTPQEFQAADINSDGKVDILDVVGIVNLALASPE